VEDCELWERGNQKKGTEREVIEGSEIPGHVLKNSKISKVP
jgi:hypothetical protein